MLHLVAPFTVVTVGFATADVVYDASSPAAILTSAGIGALALSVGWMLLRRSDSRERQMADEARKQLAQEQLAHDKTRELLMQALRHARELP